MPVKRRRRRKIQESQFIYLQTSQERNLQKIDSDIRTIPDQTFGKVYSNQILESNVSKTRKSMKRKTNNRKL
jgi:ubiquinone biosynthesis protein Coq4